MRSDVEVRVAIVHDIDQHENAILTAALMTYQDSVNLQPYETGLIQELLDGLNEMNRKAEDLRDRVNREISNSDSEMPVRSRKQA
jgi:hypothetical protein